MWLVPNAQKNEMEPIMITLEPNGQYIEEEPHEGEEFGFVLSGTIILHLGSPANIFTVLYFKEPCKIIFRPPFCHFYI